MMKAAVNFSMLYVISEMVAGSHIKLYQELWRVLGCIKFVAGKLSGHKVLFLPLFCL